ncbi:MAG: prepilin-type N-terminal cleavage/methylation domain-containing protein [Candidatus Omnitrophica bacterium]|jgi:prepilin-type N-terminal cleavage/methylation domain-containing protein|nr:prepilin-type N-terminal cleavage/methylation domain-containing protein [Candidatus Omnitrophota bacterium]
MNKKGFTLIELLVVIAIIVILMSMLLPALKKGQQTAAIDQAKAEMAALAGTEEMVKNDTGWYVRLADLGNKSPLTSTEVSPVVNGASMGSYTDTTDTFAYVQWKNYPNTPPIYTDSTSSESQLTYPTTWNGPYQIFQPKDCYYSGQGSYQANGSLLTVKSTVPTGGPGEWRGSPVQVSDGTPLDPWGHPYLMAWNSNLDVMVIYSGGPDGVLGTEAGAVVAGDTAVNGTGASTDTINKSDDLVYEFR